MPEPVSRDFTVTVRKARRQFIDSIEPLRPELYRYCRSLTRDVWDAEDLVQETLLKAFAKLADVHWQVDNPRAYLFRVASNHWIDQSRKAREADMPQEFEAPAPDNPPQPDVREAMARLATSLPPVERAAVLLKDVFAFSLEDAANHLQTSVGGVKAALHRGRPGEIYNVSGDSLTHREANRLISRLAGISEFRINVPGWLMITFARAWSKLAERTGREPYYPINMAGYVFNDWRVSSAKARTELGFVPTSFEEGARQTLEWYWNTGFFRRPRAATAPQPMAAPRPR